MRIASWNINSLRKRQDRLFAWLEDTQPDIVCLQETKCPDEQFPALALQAAGFRSAYHGEKSYNGVAILAKNELREVRDSLCDEVVAPEDIDVYDADLWHGAIMASDGERAAFRDLCSLGLHDTLRIHHDEGELFSWWDYQMRAFEKNRGLRIDAVLTGGSLANKCIASGIDREMRAGKDPSDHAPAWAEVRV